MSSMIKASDYIDSYRLSKDKQVIEGTVRIGDMERLAESALNPEDLFTFKIVGMVGKLGWPGAYMDLSGSVRLICNRCNQPVDIPIEREVTFRFAKNEEEADSIPIEEDDDTEVIIGSERLPLMPWIEEEILLSLPIVPVHDTACGQDVLGKLEADTLEKPNPFAKLKELKGLRS